MIMSNNKAETAVASTVIAIVQEENRLRAVCLAKDGRNFKVLWLKSSEVGQADWRSFAAECGFLAELTGQTKTDGATIIVAGFDSSGIVFHRISMPAVREEEIDAMVRLQAEARLPLPVEQMELAWRAGRVRDGRVAVTIAAAKREPLQKFVEQIRELRPGKIILDCEGIVKVWKEFFSGNQESPQAGVVVSIGLRNTQVCLVEDGRLSNAASLDMGVEDFSAAEASTEATETAERFAQDTRSVLELFGCAEPADVPVFVLSDSNSGRPDTEKSVRETGVIETVVSRLGASGLNVRAALPEIQKLRTKSEFHHAKNIYEYRLPIGLGLMAFDDDTKELNIFERLYSPAQKGEKKRWMYCPKVTGAIAAVMLVLLVFVFYASDVAGRAAIKGHLRGSGSNTSCDLLMQRQKLIKTVALQRPDMLELLSEINSIDSKEIMLDSLYFKMGEPVRITGQVKSAEELYKFEKSLQSKKAIKDVKIQSAPKDSKSKKLKFTITFHYKNFTKKKNL